MLMALLAMALCVVGLARSAPTALGLVLDRADDGRENGSASPACDHLRNDATNA
jgi:hypothetical protein